MTTLYRIKPLREVERDHILSTFEACGRDIHKAAAALEIAERTLYRRLGGYGVQTPRKFDSKPSKIELVAALKLYRTKMAVAHFFKVYPSTITRWAKSYNL